MSTLDLLKAEAAPKIARVVAAATTNVTLVKDAPSVLSGFLLTNLSAAAKYVKIYDKATAPVLATDTPVATIALPAGAVATFPVDLGLTKGFGYAITGAAADDDATAVAANDVIGFFAHS